ncbi:bifunctional diguanylate cyclase/phosphodiesterase [Azospirillum halopraeferens]|uniref:bifunctional diguanylate cyclase/phosphodiesterase n=1 Tax=Azospirillum halopraeferens TaxID=34010 RepID=UPI000414ECDE|nr:cache domain-containing protein [Azospirillum halopraeferens]
MPDTVIDIPLEEPREADEARVYRLQFLASLTLSALLVIGLGLFFVYQHVMDFQAAREQAEARHLEDQRVALMQQVEHARDYLEFMRSRTETVLKLEIRRQVDFAHSIAMAIYDRDRDHRPPEEIQAAIRETLRPLRFFDGRGYFFVDDLEGNCILLPINPELEGTSLLDNRDDMGTYIMRDLIRSVQTPERQGYSRYRWYAPGGGGRMMEKIAYSRLFAPYDWLIGAGEYLEVVEELLQEEALERLRALRFGRDGYIAVLHADGMVLSSPTVPESEGRAVESLATREERDLVRRLIALGREGGGTLRYDWIRPSTGHTAPKLSYVSAPNAWGWIMVAGVYLDELEAAMAAQRDELWVGVELRIVTTVAVLLLALAGSVVISWLVTGWIRRIVGGYRSRVRQSDSMLRERARQLHLSNFFLDHVSEVVVLADAERRVVYVNPFGCQVLGARAEDLTGRPAALLEGCAPDVDRDTRYETTLRTPDGRTLHLEVTASRIIYDGHGHLCAIARDVTERRRAEWEMRLGAKVFDHAAEGMMVTDADNRLVAVNDAFERITGYSRAEAIGRNPGMLASGRHGPEFYTAMWRSLQDEGGWSGEVWNRRKSGEVYPEWLSIRVVRDADGVVGNYIAAFTDVSESRAQEERIRRLAQYDVLTDLPNRVLLRDRLDRALAAAVRTGRKVGVLFVDLDRFKTINDSLGHAVGDALLRDVAHRLSEAVRGADTVSRQGGDEFVILLSDLEMPEAAGTVARKLLALLSEPYRIEGHELRVTPSIGIAVFPDDGTTGDALLKSADMAMYAAKESGRATYQFFTMELNRRASERLWLESNLRRAIENGDMELHYQPQVRIEGRRMVGCEALVRWRQPDGRLIPPSHFIPIAEDTGLILPLGDWVLDEACRRAADLRNAPGGHIAAGEMFRMAVNLSAVQLRRPGLPQRLADMLSRHGLAAAALELEVTESMLMDDSETIADTMARLREMGVALAIDDFGTGYSSLSYLKRFHADKLKIDRSFVSGLARDPDGTAIAGAIISMARALRMETLAEGVETDEQLEHLAAMGCEQIQGFLIGHPMPFEEFVEFLAQHRGERLEA